MSPRAGVSLDPATFSDADPDAVGLDTLTGSQKLILHSTDYGSVPLIYPDQNSELAARVVRLWESDTLQEFGRYLRHHEKTDPTRGQCLAYCAEFVYSALAGGLWRKPEHLKPWRWVAAPISHVGRHSWIELRGEAMEVTLVEQGDGSKRALLIEPARAFRSRRQIKQAASRSFEEATHWINGKFNVLFPKAFREELAEWRELLRSDARQHLEHCSGCDRCQWRAHR